MENPSEFKGRMLKEHAERPIGLSFMVAMVLCLAIVGAIALVVIFVDAINPKPKPEASTPWGGRKDGPDWNDIEARDFVAIRFVTNPLRAQVTVDGRVISGPSDKDDISDTVRLRRGVKHQVTASAFGYVTYQGEVEFANDHGYRSFVYITLDKKPADWQRNGIPAIRGEPLP
jgi:hypothetical protein